GPDRLAHRVVLVYPGDAGALYEAAVGSFGDEPDAARLDQSHDETGRAQMGESVRVLEGVDDLPHGAGVAEGGGGELDDVGLPAVGVLLFGLRAVGLAVAQFLGGVPDDADAAARPAGRVPADVALGVGP